MIRAYQSAIKNFCENPNQSVRNNKSNFYEEPSITFFNQGTRQIVIFKQETKIFITAYKLSDRHINKCLKSGGIGSN